MHSDQAKAGDRHGREGMHTDAVFSIDWLALRRPADTAARAHALEARARTWLDARRGGSPRALHLVDLGSGSGANPAHLAPRLPGPQRWTLVDRDNALLVHARHACASLCDAEGKPVSVHTRLQDLATLDELTIGEADLVCASALLDLVDASWIERLAAACDAHGSAVFVTLSVDGSWRFERLCAPESSAAGVPVWEADTDVDDPVVNEAFNAHQRGDKGIGAALGPDAAACLATALRTRGFDVELAASPWQLQLDDSRQSQLARALIDGWREAACAQLPAMAERIRHWHARRQAWCAGYSGRLVVGHVDLFASPPRSST